MIENVGFLDQTKNIVTDEDFEFKKATFVASGETPLSSLSGNFCVYNKFYCLLNGTIKGLLAKIKHFFHKGEVLVC